MASNTADGSNVTPALCNVTDGNQAACHPCVLFSCITSDERMARVVVGGEWGVSREYSIVPQLSLKFSLAVKRNLAQSYSRAQETGLQKRVNRIMTHHVRAQLENFSMDTVRTQQ